MKTYTIKIDDNGTKSWYLNNKLHREDGPAIEYPDGCKYWYLNGNFHREDGPAIEWENGTKFWFLNGKEYSESKWKKLVNKKSNSCDGKIVEIEGVKYKLTLVE